MAVTQDYENIPPLKLHDASPIFYFIDTVKSFALVIIFAFFATTPDSWEMWALAGGAFFVIPQIIRARFFKYWLLEEELVVKSGVFFKQERHIPYERIQNINQTEGILHRLFKVCKVQLESASGTKPEAEFNVISLQAVVAIRAASQERKTLNSFDDELVVAQVLNTQTLINLRLPEVVKLGLINLQGLIPIAILFSVVSQQPGIWDRVSFSWLDNLRSALRSIEGVDYTGTPGLFIASIFGLILFGLICFWILSILVAIFRFYNYTLSLEDEKITAVMGLFTRKNTSASVKRIQKITLTEGLIHRLFNRVSVTCKTAGNAAGSGGVSGSFHYLAPLIEKEKAAEFINAIQKEIDWTIFAEGSKAWKAIPYRAWTRILKFPLFISILACGFTAFLMQWWALAFVPVFAFVVYDAQRSAKAMAYMFNDEFIAYRSGWISKDVSVVKIEKAQVAVIHQNPFDRRRVMAKFYLDTAGMSIIDHKIKIKYMEFADAIFLQKRITYLTNKQEFKW